MEKINKCRITFALCIMLLLGCSKEEDNHEFETYVPDDKFEQLLIDMGLDYKMDNYVLTSRIKDVKSINTTKSAAYSFWGIGVKDFTGLEDFVDLETLICIDNGLTYLDVSKNLALKHLNCSDNNISSLDVRKNIELEYLAVGNAYFGGNNLSSLDVSQNIALVDLFCDKNNLTNIDVSRNINLSNFSFSSNNLKSLDISSIKQLTSLNYVNNPLLKCIQVNQEQLDNIITGPISIYPRAIEIFSTNCN